MAVPFLFLIPSAILRLPAVASSLPLTAEIKNIGKLEQLQKNENKRTDHHHSFVPPIMEDFQGS
jgi:hypothetical protein